MTTQQEKIEFAKEYNHLFYARLESAFSYLNIDSDMTFADHMCLLGQAFTAHQFALQDPGWSTNPDDLANKFPTIRHMWLLDFFREMEGVYMMMKEGEEVES